MNDSVIRERGPLYERRYLHPSNSTLHYHGLFLSNVCSTVAMGCALVVFYHAGNCSVKKVDTRAPLCHEETSENKMKMSGVQTSTKAKQSLFGLV